MHTSSRFWSCREFKIGEGSSLDWDFADGQQKKKEHGGAAYKKILEIAVEEHQSTLQDGAETMELKCNNLSLLLLLWWRVPAFVVWQHLRAEEGAEKTLQISFGPARNRTWYHATRASLHAVARRSKTKNPKETTTKEKMNLGLSPYKMRKRKELRLLGNVARPAASKCSISVLLEFSKLLVVSISGCYQEILDQHRD